MKTTRPFGELTPGDRIWFYADYPVEKTAIKTAPFIVRAGDLDLHCNAMSADGNPMTYFDDQLVVHLTE